MPTQPAASPASAWSAPREEDCPEVQRNTISGGLYSRIRQVCGYFNGEFSFYSYSFEVLIDGRETVFAQIWTEGRSVVHAEFDERGTEVHRSTIADLTCQEDIVRTHSDAAKLAMSYLNTHPEGR
jgi:hypothetical protein